MSVSQEPVFTLPTSGPAVSVKTFLLVFSMISTNGPLNLATASTRPKRC
jgi:hypothetical protein